MKKLAALALTALIVTGCAQAPRLNTPSGKPEATYNTPDKGRVKGAIISVLMARGYAIDNEGDYSLTMSKEAQGGGAVLYQALAGNAYSSTPRATILAAFAVTDGQTHVYLQGQMRMQNAFGRQDVQDMTAGAGKDLMKLLDETRTQLETTH